MHREAWREAQLSFTHVEASVVPEKLMILWVKSAQTQCLASRQERGRETSFISLALRPRARLASGCCWSTDMMPQNILVLGP